MPDIKMRAAVEKSVKTIDKSAIAPAWIGVLFSSVGAPMSAGILTQV